ncbi:MAG: LysR family transcriptional regulator [Verrucomicrobia bacterium]|nr:LysR family transcriptional regulator [Verrucomicrobiota bacterium]
MQIEALKLYCDVVRFRSFSQAAAANAVTQSAASQVISQIERRLNQQMLDRSTRPLTLTEQGRRFYEGCESIVRQYDELLDAMQTTPAGLPPVIHIAAIYSVGFNNMHLIIEAFNTDNPDVDVHIEYLHPDKVYEKVHEGAADLGLASFPRPTRDLCSLPWREEEMVLTCSPSHALAGKSVIAPADLANETYVGFNKGLVIRRTIDRFLKEYGVHVNVVVAFDNIETIKKAIEANEGVALLPHPTLLREIESGALVAIPLEGKPLVRPLGIIYRNHKLSAAAQRLVDVLQRPEQARLATRKTTAVLAAS